MNFYIVFLLVISVEYVFLTLLIKNKEKKNKVFLIISFLQMFIIMSIRSIEVGADLERYIPFYERCKDYSWTQIFEPGLKEYGYRIYNKILSLFLNEQLFLMMTAGITLIGVYYVIKKYSKNYFLSIYIYISFNFFIFTFSGLRQAIAISLGMLSIKYIDERKFWKFLILILLASTFHMSSLILVPMYFLRNINVKPKILPLVAIVYFILFIARRQIIAFILMFVYDNYALSNTGNGYVYLLLLMVIVIGITIYKKQFLQEGRLNNFFYNVLLIALLLQLFASAQGEVARLTMYYSIYMIIAIPNFIKSIKTREQRYLLEVIVIIALFIYMLINIYDLNLYPTYTTFFNE